MRPVPKKFVFLCGAHFDQIMRLDQPAVMGVSNPARISNIPGGAALNSASTAATLGLEVTLLSPVGNDLNGRHLVSVCRERGINPALIITEDLPTGIYSALFQPDGDIVIGASDLAIYGIIDYGWLEENLRPILKKGMGLFLNANLEMPQLLEAVANAGFVAAATISPAKAGRLAAILGRIDCLFTNLGEARILAGMAEADAPALVDWLMANGVDAGTLSHGGNDLYFWHDGKSNKLAPQRPEKMVDVNGAGDALAGAILAELGAGKTFQEAVEFGNRVAAFSLTHDGPYSPELRNKGPKLR